MPHNSVAPANKQYVKTEETLNPPGFKYQQKVKTQKKLKTTPKLILDLKLCVCFHFCVFCGVILGFRWEFSSPPIPVASLGKAATGSLFTEYA